ncbi:MAG: CRISPR-associated protein Csx20 [Bacillota bacterium]|nr:CRISPR-associated protein Csx20 [Bacillota bacterium]
MAKKLISFLGTQPYKEAVYTWGEEVLPPTRFVQEALFRLLSRDWGGEDQVVILLTEEARERNFPALKEALGAAFRERGLPAYIKDLSISGDESEKSLWELYRRLLEILEPQDTLFFDVTHGFRFFSLFAYGVVEYGRVLKGVEVGGLYYGMYRQGQAVHPIMDLTPLVQLLDWTHGTRTYLQTGDARALQEVAQSVAKAVFGGKKRGDHSALVAQKNLVRSLEDFHENIATCRTLRLPGNVAAIQERLEKSKAVSFDVFPLLDPLLEKIEDKFRLVQDDMEKDLPLSRIGLAAARWCQEHGYIQQGYTFLVEAVISKGVEILGLDPQNKDHRQKAGRAITAYVGVRGRGQLPRKEGDHPLAPLAEIIQKNFSPIVHTRNAINHGGIAQDPKEKTSSETLARRLEEHLKMAQELMEQMDKVAGPSEEAPYEPRLLILLSHKLLPEQEADARRTLGVGGCTYLPEDLQTIWSQIDPSVEDLEEDLAPIGRWLEEEGQPGDYVLIQGEYGATVWAIEKARFLAMLPVYSTTRREVEVEETGDGQVVRKSVFRHVRFRPYPQPREA